MNLSIIAISAAIALTVSVLSYAGDKMNANADIQYEKSTTHNPLTKTTTRTVTRKSKRHSRSLKGSAMSEDKSKVEVKKSDDGTKSSVRTETVHSDEQSK